MMIGWGMGGVGLLLLVGIVWLISSAQWNPADVSPKSGPDARRILEHRFARGEINQTEYLDRLAVLDRR